MTKKAKDPFHAREQEKYEHPIPSREYIMMVLEDFGRPITRNQIIKKLDIHDESKQEALNFRLRAMLRDGQLMQDRRGRYCLFERINLRRGTIQAHPDGFGFFISDGEEPDMILSASEMRGVMHGDVVLAFQTSLDRRGR
ncbi:MAG: ribonuclease R, partial [Gammaproteobacteria bacterium]|nr:ribonuclease R [Gammaproteobacteria bacterium]